jgi:hypothetical protein
LRNAKFALREHEEIDMRRIVSVAAFIAILAFALIFLVNSNGVSTSADSRKAASSASIHDLHTEAHRRGLPVQMVQDPL